MSATLPPSPARPVHPALRCPRGGTVGCDCDRDGKDARECFWWITYVDTSTGAAPQGDDEWDDYVDLDHDDIDYHDHNDDDSESDDSAGFVAEHLRRNLDEHARLDLHKKRGIRRELLDRRRRALWRRISVLGGNLAEPGLLGSAEWGTSVGTGRGGIEALRMGPGEHRERVLGMGDSGGVRTWVNG